MPTGYFVPAPPQIDPSAVVVAHAASATLTVADAGKIHTNTGAGGATIYTLPAPSDFAGCALRVQLTVAQTVQLLPPAGKSIYLGGSGVASKYALIAGVIGNYCDVYCDGMDYLIMHYSGVVTKEP
jgi:hypothetical protein